MVFEVRMEIEVVSASPAKRVGGLYSVTVSGSGGRASEAPSPLHERGWHLVKFGFLVCEANEEKNMFE